MVQAESLGDFQEIIYPLASTPLASDSAQPAEDCSLSGVVVRFPQGREQSGTAFLHPKLGQNIGRVGICFHRGVDVTDFAIGSDDIGHPFRIATAVCVIGFGNFPGGVR